MNSDGLSGNQIVFGSSETISTVLYGLGILADIMVRFSKESLLMKSRCPTSLVDFKEIKCRWGFGKMAEC